MSAMTATRTPFVQNSEAWLGARLDGVGSSDVPVIVGEREGLMSLWAVKSRLLPPEPPDEALQALFDIGHALEPVLRRLYTAKTGRSVQRVTRMLQHPQEPWMLASLDGRSGRRVVELKWSNSARWYGDEELPGDALAQVMWQMHVSGLEAADVAVLKGRDFEVIEVPRDQGYIDDMLVVVREFWQHVQDGTRPDVDATEDTRRALTRLHPRDTGPFLAPTPEIDLLARQLAQARGEARDAKDLEGSLKNAFRTLLGEAAGVQGDGYKITWTKNRDSTSTETNWPAVASAFRHLLLSDEDVLDVTDSEALDAIESLHSVTTTKEGARVLRTTGPLFKAPPKPQEYPE